MEPFDKVDKERLMHKLCSRGFCNKLLVLFDSYLDPRSAVVVIDGAASEPFPLTNMIFKGPFLDLACGTFSLRMFVHVSPNLSSQTRDLRMT